MSKITTTNAEIQCELKVGLVTRCVGVGLHTEERAVAHIHYSTQTQRIDDVVAGNERFREINKSSIK